MDEQQYETSKIKVNSCGVIPVKARPQAWDRHQEPANGVSATDQGQSKAQ
jgi:hypothetical protein